MSTDLFGTLRQLRHAARNARGLDPQHAATLNKLGLIALVKNPLGGTIASLTPAGHAKVHELDTEGMAPSPTGERAGRELSDTALLALHDVSNGKPVDAGTAQALARMNLATQQNGCDVLTRRGADLLSSTTSRERLQSLLNPHKRG